MGELTSLVDTSVLIGALEVVQAAKEGTWAVSVVTIGELHAGVLLATHGATQSGRLKRLAAVLSLVSVLDVGRSVAVAYGDLRMVSGRSPSNDLWIAATALANDLELVTLDREQAALPLVRTHQL
ncbi:MAG: type II toxin-antitoxin system VapC family toxin [Solirubrobacteraceae bacterium]